jgi:hypothetical protein
VWHSASSRNFQQRKVGVTVSIAVGGLSDISAQGPSSKERASIDRTDAAMDLQAIAHFARDAFLPTVTAHIIIASSLAFISPHATSIRIAASVVTAALCFEAIRRCNKRTSEESSYADYMFGLAFHTNCYLVLLNLSPPSDLTTTWQRLQWGTNALFSPRMGTKPYRRDPPSTTKREFLMRRITTAIAIGTFWLYIREGLRFYPCDLGPEDWDSRKTYMTPGILNGTLTLRDLWFRVVLAFYAYSGSALTICGAHTVCALIAVGIFDSPLQDWPPLFGNITQAYTLRRWYSHFWHKAMRKAFTIHAVVVTEKGLGLRKHTIPGRSVIVLLSFFFSGVMHSVTSWHSGPCSDHFAPVRSFMLFGIFILLEQAVMSAYLEVYRRLRIPWTGLELVFWRLFGRCWVVFFLLEFTITSAYTNLQCVWSLDEV